MDGINITRLSERRRMYVISVVLIGLLDSITPADVIILAFLVIPVVASAVTGDLTFMRRLTLLAVLSAVSASWYHRYAVPQTLVRVSALVVAGAVAGSLATLLRRQNERLQAAHDRYQMLVENTSDVVLLADLDGTIRWASPSTRRTLHWEPAQMVGTRTFEYLHPDEVDAIAIALREHAKRGTEANVLARFRCGDGKYRWLESAGNQILATPSFPAGRVVRLRDVTSEVEQRQALEASETHFRLLAENSSDVVLLVQDGLIRWVSPAVVAALGWDPEHWQGRHFEEIVHVDDRLFAQGSYAANAAGETRITRVRMQSAAGGWHWAEVHSGPFISEAGDSDGVVASFRLIDTEVAAEQELERRATYDDLTGALNRNAGLAQLQTLSDQRRTADGESAALFIDVDEFKAVNDTHGHLVGDAVLIAIVQRIRSHVRARDMVARMGGDEFLVLLWACTAATMHSRSPRRFVRPSKRQ